jgi:hypothetical protein
MMTAAGTCSAATGPDVHVVYAIFSRDVHPRALALALLDQLIEFGSDRGSVARFSSSRSRRREPLAAR